MSGAREITLSRGLVAIVDEADFAWLSQWKWCAVSTARKGGPPRFYAGRMDNGKMVLMHRVIAEPQPSQVVDHGDGETLNNRRKNLVNCTQRENSRNRHPDRTMIHAPARVETSRQKGVTWNRRQNKWVVQVNRQHVGVFVDETRAIAAARAAIGGLS